MRRTPGLKASGGGRSGVKTHRPGTLGSRICIQLTATQTEAGGAGVRPISSELHVRRRFATPPPGASTTSSSGPGGIGAVEGTPLWQSHPVHKRRTPNSGAGSSDDSRRLGLEGCCPAQVLDAGAPSSRRSSADFASQQLHLRRPSNRPPRRRAVSDPAAAKLADEPTVVYGFADTRGSISTRRDVRRQRNRGRRGRGAGAVRRAAGGGRAAAPGGGRPDSSRPRSRRVQAVARQGTTSRRCPPVSCSLAVKRFRPKGAEGCPLNGFRRSSPAVPRARRQNTLLCPGSSTRRRIAQRPVVGLCGTARDTSCVRDNPNYRARDGCDYFWCSPHPNFTARRGRKLDPR